MVTQNLPEFTIAIPVHNGEPFIAEAIESLVNQTYPHFNIVVLENASTDNTVEIIQQYNDPRIRIQPSDKLLSIEDNWERILTIENANEYLVLMCADDILYPEFLAEIAKLIIAEPNATLYHTHAEYIDARNKRVRRALMASYRETANEFLTALHSYKQDAFGTGYVMKFEDFKKVGGYPKFQRLNLADFYCYYALTKLGYKVCVQTKLAGFRVNPQGVGSTSVIEDFKIAEQQYRNALLVDSEFTGEELLNDFLETFVLLQYRQYLKSAVTSKQQIDQEIFEKYRKEFLSQAYRKRAKPYDFPLAWYVQVTKMPTWILRNIVLYTMLVIFFVRRRLAII